MCLRCYYTVAVVLAAVFPAIGQTDPFGLLTKPSGAGPLGREHSLTDGLKEVALRATDLMNLAIELRPDDHENPSVFVRFREGATVGDVIADIMAQQPAYEYEVISPHLLSVFRVVPNPTRTTSLIRNFRGSTWSGFSLD